MHTITGAEATITFDAVTVTKQRTPKAYRIKPIDNQLRTERTKAEARILAKLHSKKLPVPKVISTTNDTIVMQRIQGQKLRDALTPDTVADYAQQLVRLIAAMHELHITHGDLTTSNVLVNGNNALVLIDFGLAQHNARVEDKAVDLHVLEEALHAYHHNCAEQFMDIITTHYDDKAVLTRLRVVQQRGKNKTKATVQEKEHIHTTSF